MARTGEPGDAPTGKHGGLEVTLLMPDPSDGGADDAGLDGTDPEDVLSGGYRGRFGRVRPPVRSPRDRRPSALAAGLHRVGRALGRRWLALEAGRRRLIAIVGAIVVLISAATAITLTRPAGPATADPGPSLSYDPNADTTSAIGAALAVDGGDVVDVAIGTSDVYVASRDSLSVVDATSHKVLRATEVTSTTDGQLVFDATAATVWDIDLGSVPGRVREYAVDTLTLTRSLVVQGIIYDAVVLDGRLYLATSLGVELIEPGSTTLAAVTATTPEAQALTANPAAHTVLALAPGTGGRIVTISNDGNTIQAGPALNVSYPTIALVGNALWAGGVDPDARLLRIDDKTMRPLPESAGGAMVAEGSNNDLQAIPGSQNLWIFSRNDQRLYCADSQTGEVLQIWNGVSHTVATGGHTPYAVTHGQAKPLELRGRCTG